MELLFCIVTVFILEKKEFFRLLIPSLVSGPKWIPRQKKSQNSGKQRPDLGISLLWERIKQRKPDAAVYKYPV